MTRPVHYITIFGRPVRSWMVTAALAASAVAYSGLVFLPRQRAISQLRTEVNAKEQHILQAERLGGPIRQAELRLASTREFSDHWRQAAPTAVNLTKLFAQLADEAKLAGVNVQRFDPQPAVEMKSLSQFPVDLTFQGTFAQVFDFIGRIEALPPTMWIRDFHLAAEAADSQTLQAEMTLTIFADRNDNSN